MPWEEFVSQTVGLPHRQDSYGHLGWHGQHGIAKGWHGQHGLAKGWHGLAMLAWSWASNVSNDNVSTVLGLQYQHGLV